MQLEAFVDFYFLEAVRSTPLNMMRKPEEKLKYDVEQYFRDFTKNFALAIRDYLYLSSFGEARHASNKSTNYWPGNKSSLSRLQSYHLAIKYQPEQALPILYEIFKNQSWGGSYGGAKWANIVNVARTYGQLPNTVFIDQAANLQHWNGFVFSKFEVNNILDWNLSPDTFSKLNGWLKQKAEVIDLLKLPNINILPTQIGSKTQSLVHRYFNVWEPAGKAPEWWWQQTTLDDNIFDYKPFKFGNNKVPEVLIPSGGTYDYYIKLKPQFSKECVCVICSFNASGKTTAEAKKTWKEIVDQHFNTITTIEKDIQNFHGKEKEVSEPIIPPVTIIPPFIITQGTT